MFNSKMRILGTLGAWLALVVGIGGALPAAAHNCAFPGNPLPNCGFATDLSGGWYFTADSAVHFPGDGASAPGCAAVDRHNGVNAIEVFSPCVAVTPGVELGAGASARLASGAIDNICSISVIRYPDPDCGGVPTVAYGTAPVPGSTWRSYADPYAIDGTVDSLQMRLACFSSVDFVLRVDDFWVSVALFHDGFESGGTGAWSAAVPSPQGDS